MPNYPTYRVPFSHDPKTMTSELWGESHFIATIALSEDGPEGRPDSDEPLQTLRYHPDLNLEGGAYVSAVAASMISPLPHEDGASPIPGRPLREDDRFRVWVQNREGFRYPLVLTVKKVIAEGYPLNQSGSERAIPGFYIFASMDELQEEFDLVDIPDEKDHRASRVHEDRDELVLHAFKGGCIPPSGRKAEAAA